MLPTGLKLAFILTGYYTPLHTSYHLGVPVPISTLKKAGTRSPTTNLPGQFLEGNTLFDITATSGQRCPKKAACCELAM